MDIRLDVGFFQHPKTIKLERRLGLEGVKALLQLWMWAAKERPEGVLSNMDDEDIEIAANWAADGPLVSVLVELRWIDRTDEGPVLHDWADHNSWVAASVDRGDRARLSRMAYTHPQLYARLVQEGRVSISRQEYIALTRSNGTLTFVDAASTPSPSPSPSPDYIEDQEISTGYPQGYTRGYTQALKKALDAYHLFAAKRNDDKAWVRDVCLNFPNIDVAVVFQEASKWARDKGLEIRSQRAFLLRWIKRLHKEQISRGKKGAMIR